MVSSTRAPSYIAPERLYSLKGFQIASGVSATRIREAKLAGIELPTVRVGRRKWVRGSDGIAFILQLAEMSTSHDD